MSDLINRNKKEEKKKKKNKQVFDDEHCTMCTSDFGKYAHKPEI